MDKRIFRLQVYAAVRVNAVCILIFLAGLGIFLSCTPKYNDDFWYSTPMRSWFESQGAVGLECGWGVLLSGVPWRAISEVWAEHCATDNARLGNILVPFFLLLPKWAASIPGIAAWTLCMRSSFILARVDWRRSGVVMAGLFLWSFAMAWSQHMGSLVYQFNYLIPSGLVTAYILYAARSSHKGSGMAFLFLAGIPVGAWHEGFTIPTLAGFLAVMICYRRCRKKRYIVASAGLIAGVALLIAAPAGSVRLDREFLHGLSLSRGVLSLLAGHPVFVLYSALMIIRVCRRGLKSLGPLPLFIISGSMVILAIQFLTTGERRVGWWADVMSIIGVMYMTVNFFRSVPENRMRPWYLAYTMLAVAMCVHWAAIDIYTLRLRQTFLGVLQRHYAGERVVFADISLFTDLPAICVGTPDVGMLFSPYTLPYLNRYYHSEDSAVYLTVIPLSLQKVTAASGESVPGGTDIRKEKGFFFSEGRCGYAEEREMSVSLNNGIKTAVRFICWPFRSSGDGREYVFYYPWHGNWILQTGNIERIEK